MKQNKGSTGSTAAFVAVMTVIIILYILFLPPEIREELLNEGSAKGSGFGTSPDGTGFQKSLLSEKIGKVEYLNTKEKTYDIPTTRISSPVESQIIKSVNSLYVKSALFDREFYSQNVVFTIDKESTNNVMLSFNVEKKSGPLVIDLNGKRIFYGEVEVGNAKPIAISNEDLLTENTLTFSVTNPGWLFWKTHTYTVSNMQISGDVTDFKNSRATHFFRISTSEKNNLEEVKLLFYPECKSDVGPLTIELNKRIIFNSVADCGTRTIATLDNDQILEGNNELSFYSYKGSYLLDNIDIKVNLKKPTYNVLFFDMDEEYFNVEPERKKCGEYDGVCPIGCSDYTDADCCFERGGYWCALPTSSSSNRCVFYVNSNDCNICKTGYYDTDGDPYKNCEGKCGDNTDGICPPNCPSSDQRYDKDCCFEENEDNYWCQEVPVTGIADRCKANIRYEDCEICPSGFENIDGETPSACEDYVDYTEEDDEYELLSNYDVTLKTRFTNDDLRKRLTLNINGHMINIDTKDIEFIRNIDDYVRKDSNSIEIIPKEDVDIAELKIDIKRVK